MRFSRAGRSRVVCGKSWDRELHVRGSALCSAKNHAGWLPPIDQDKTRTASPGCMSLQVIPFDGFVQAALDAWNGAWQR